MLPSFAIILQGCDADDGDFFDFKFLVVMIRRLSYMVPVSSYHVGFLSFPAFVRGPFRASDFQ
jgi:hypothetical protein